MTRTITTAAELDALPVGSVVLGADLPDIPRRPLGERISPRWDPDARWNVDGRHYYGVTETVLAVLGGAATVLHDPSAPAPSVAPEDAVEAAASAVRKERAFSAAVAFGVPMDDVPQCAEMIARAALAAALPLLTAAPSATRDEVAQWALAASSVTITDSPYQKAEGLHIADALLARFTIIPKEDR